MWDDQGEVLIGKFGIDNWTVSKNLEVIMFDLDDTLIKPSEKVRPGAPYTKWDFGKGVVKKLADLDPKSLMVIISNQAKLDQYKESFQTKLEEVINELRESQIEVPVLVYVANGYNKFRKPSTGIITEYLIPFLSENGVQKISRWSYVGDAAGRKTDHSDSDRKFAMNINMILRGKNKIGDITVPNLVFMEPEVYFLGRKPTPFSLSSFDPQRFIGKFLKDADGTKRKLSELDVSINYLKPSFFTEKEQEVILLIGPPGIGKSALAKRIERDWDYVRINQDTLGSKGAVDKELYKTLQTGSSVVLDSTNGNLKRRREQIAIASQYFREKEKPVHIRALVMAGELPIKEQRALAEHMNIVRERASGDNAKQRVPEIVYRLYYKDYTPPTEDEGFTEIVNVKFVPRFIKPEDALHFLQRT